MLGGDDGVEEIVLNIVYPIQDRSLVMVINDRNGPDNFLVLLPLFLYQFLADEIAERLGTIGILPRSDQAVKFLQKRFIK